MTDSYRMDQLASLGGYRPAVDTALAEMAGEQIVARIWAHDHTVWKPEPAEITNRLGWLHIAEGMVENVPRMEALASEVQEAGYTHVLLLGMGGSSLAPELFSETFGDFRSLADFGSLNLAVLDSTDPGAVLAQAERLDPVRTLFVIATKSGGTAETLSFFKFFYNWAADALGAGEAGEHFIAITDPGSKLVDIAERYEFRAVFLNDPDIGGRFSALSTFGLLPAALVGVDVSRLLDRAMAMARGCKPGVPLADNPGVWLGAVLGELAKSGRDKVTFAISPAIVSFGDWVEQLVAESTGKEGQGILPVVGEPLGTVGVYGFDRLFVHLRLEGDKTYDADLAAFEASGYPVVRFNLQDVYDLGGQFFLWEFATAVASYRLGINPFNQPNVESAKAQARKMIAEYKEKGTLPSLTPALSGDGITVYGDLEAISPEKALPSFLSQPRLRRAKKVVVIEDEPEMVDLVKLILGRKGFELIGAVGGQEGLEVVRREKPDLVLVDLVMPDMDGWEVYQKIKADDELKDIPIVVVTARVRDIDKYLGLGKGEPADFALRKPVETADEALIAFLDQAQMGDYVSLQAYVQPTPDTDVALAELRLKLRDRFRLATTVGYGPRFLHSTGQLHKGDAGNGLFIQFTHDPPQDAAIPDEAGKPESSVTFGVLIAAQALGDRQALLDSGRRVIRFHLGSDVVGGLKRLTEAVR
jgi:glucose-6-phosphate isomerase/CheY-like chemotaxis protein